MLSFIRKLLGRKPNAIAAAASLSTQQAIASGGDPAQDPNMIRVYDSYGREMFITKQQWRDNVLEGHLQKVWNQPEELYAAIGQALRDGFKEEMIAPARQFAKISPDPERGAVLLGVVYLENKRIDDAEKVFDEYLKSHGPSGYVLTNLAKVYSQRGESAKSLETLWRGLETDPNQENGYGWYIALAKEKGGTPAELDATKRVAALPGSWRARLWLARDSLGRGDLDAAKQSYAAAFAAIKGTAPTDFLQQMSGDLGNNGHLIEIINLVEPHFEIEKHGLEVGNNLIKAHLDLGQFEAVQKLLDLHYAQKRPDWRETLSYWDTALAKARVEAVNDTAKEKPEITILRIEGPVWLPTNSPASELFPTFSDRATKVAFLGGSATLPKPGESPTRQLSDTPGRLSRSIPLYLSEQVFFRTNSQVSTLQFWLLGDAPAFVFSGARWTDADAANYARRDPQPADYVVVTHLDTTQEPWLASLRLVRTIDAKVLGEVSRPLLVADPEPALRELANNTVSLLQSEAGIEGHRMPALAQDPTGSQFGSFLLRLEQLLSVRAATREGTPTTFLSGVREIIGGDITLCVEEPSNTVARLVLAQTLLALKKTHPQIVEEFRDQVNRLQREKPLSGVGQSVVETLMRSVYPSP